MDNFNADVLEVIANATDAKTCAKFLCVNSCSSTLIPYFPNLHLQQTIQILKNLENSLQEEYNRLCNKEVQSPFTISMLKTIFASKYNAELQYQLHKHIKEKMQNDYSFSNVQRSLQKYVCETGNYDKQDEYIIDLLSSLIYGDHFMFDITFTTYDNAYCIQLLYDFKCKTIEIIISNNDDEQEILCETEYDIHDTNTLINTLINTCGDYVIATTPIDVDVSVSCIDKLSNISLCLVNMANIGSEKNILDIIGNIFGQHQKLMNIKKDRIVALFTD